MNFKGKYQKTDKCETFQRGKDFEEAGCVNYSNKRPIEYQGIMERKPKC